LEHNIEQFKVYEKMRKDFFIWLDEMQETALTASAIIAQLTRLRQINVWPAGIVLRDPQGHPVGQVDVQDSSKIDECMDKIEEAADQVVVFSNFNEPMREVQRRCEAMKLKCRIISGANSKEMDGIESDFQNGKFDVLCLNSAMGEGLNLQKNPERYTGGASIGIFLDIWWNPARDEQCIGRIHRQGANQPVTIYRLLIPHSVDTFMLDKSNAKAAQFMSIMESDELRPTGSWKDLLEGMI
jgi:SNF2 family DNA or RNA helicase